LSQFGERVERQGKLCSRPSPAFEQVASAPLKMAGSSAVLARSMRC